MNDRRITAKEIERNVVNLRQLTFEVTDDCNLRCRYCGYGELYSGYDERKARYMNFEQIRPLIDYLVTLWRSHRADSGKPLTYFSFYGGEPLLNMKFITQMVNYADNLDIERRIVYSMTTNAMLLDRYMDYLAEHDVHLLISLDGDSEGQSYRVDRAGRNSFDRVFWNVKALQKKYPDYFLRNVNFNSVLHNRNSVGRTHEFIMNEFGKRPKISELNNSGIRPEKRDEFEHTYRNKLESLHQSENYEKLSEEMFMEEPSTNDLLLFLHQYSGNVFRSYNDLFIDPRSASCPPTGTCTPFSKKMFVTVNGRIIQCERIDHCFSMGEVSEDGMELDLQAIADRFNGWLDKLQKQCSACYRKRSCIQCLYYIDTINTPSPICQGFMDKDAFSKYSSYCLGHLRTHPYLYRRLMEEVMVE